MATREIFVCLTLAALLVNGDNAENLELPFKNITTYKGDYEKVSITIKSGSTMEECHVETPNGTVFELYPKINSTIKSIMFSGPSSCGVYISPIDLSHGGEWRLIAHHKNKADNVKTLVIQPISLKVDFTTEESENNEKIIFTKRNEKITQYISLPSFLYDLQTCFLKTVDGIIYQLYPAADSNITDPNIKRYKSSLFDECGVVISNINIGYIGKWVLYSYVESSSKGIHIIQPLEIKIEEEINTIPPKSLTVYIGEDVIVQLSETVDNLSRCEIQPPPHNDQNNYEVDNSTQCNLILRNVSREFNGQWMIKAYGQITLYGKLNIIVEGDDTEYLELPVKNITTYRGDYETVSISLKSGSTMVECHVETPNGTVFELYPKINSTIKSIKFSGSSSCGVYISPIDLSHGGEWRLIAHHKNKTDNVKTLMIQPISLKVVFTTEESENEEKIIFTKRTEKITQYISLPSYSYDLQTCFLETVDGNIYQLYPTTDSNITDPNIKSYKSYLFDECGVVISNINIGYIGKWVLYAYVESSSKGIYITQPMEIKIEEEINTIPPKSLTVYIGEDVTVQLSETVDNLSRCEIQPPPHNDQNNYEVDSSTQCNLILRNVSREFNGQWIIKAYGQITLYGKLNIIVEGDDTEYLELPVKNITTYREDYETVSISLKSGSTMVECHVETPNGTVFELYPKINSTIKSIRFSGSSSCGVYISPIDFSHRGEWRLIAHHKNKTDNVKTLVIQPISLKVVFTTEESENEEKIIFTKRTEKITQYISLPSYSYDLQTCFLETVDGIIYQLYPAADSNITDPNIKSYKSYLFDECGVVISNINIGYIGKWVLYAYVESSSKGIYITQPMEIKIEEEINTIPPKSLSVYNGEDVILQLSETVNNLSQCVIQPPPSHNKQNNYLVDNSTQCDLILRNVTSELNGQWIIKAYGQITLYGKLNIIVEDIPEIVTEYNIEFGNSAKLKFGPENSLSCQATDPKGVVHVRQHGQCSFTLERVTKAHNGTWKVRVGLPGLTRLHSYNYSITVVENITDRISSDKVVSSVEFSTDKSELFIVCSLMASSMKSCQMIRSDGDLFTLTPSTGNGRYSYHGNYKYQDDKGNNIVDCGIKVKSPEAVDLQNWQCIIKHGENNIEVGGFVSILGNDDTINEGNVTNTDKGKTNILKHTVGESFEMMCTHTDKIDYCWFQSPNKTNLVSVPDGSNQDFEYVGKGLHFGECGIKIKSAALIDSGTWTCSMGVSEAEDIQQKISVEVYESVLVAFSKFTPREYLTFGCRTYDNSSLEYCRFVRPDGKGINPQYGYMDNYFGNGTDLEEGICQLTMLKTSRTDLGMWTCAGKPFLKAEEYYDTINLIELTINSNYSLTWLALSWTFYVVTFFGIIFIISAIVHRTRLGSHIRQRTVSFRDSFSFKEKKITKA